jgi:hypothetical protein
MSDTAVILDRAQAPIRLFDFIEEQIDGRLWISVDVDGERHSWPVDAWGALEEAQELVRKKLADRYRPKRKIDRPVRQQMRA